MEEKQISSFRSLVEEKENIFIFPSLKTKGDSLLASLALFFSLEKSGRKANLILGNIPWQRQPFLSTGSLPFQPKIIIRPPASRQIKELRYEKQGDRIVFYLDSDNQTLDLKNFDLILSPQPEPDLLITLGAQKPGDILHPLFQNSFSSLPTINIDRRSSNQQFGRLNLINPRALSVCQWLTDILRQANDEWITPQVASYLLQGIKFITPEKQNKDSLSQIHYLIDKGALLSSISFPLLQSQEEIDFFQSVIKTMEVSLNPPFVFISLDNRHLLFVSPPYLSALLKALKTNFFHFKNILLLWTPDQGTVQGLVSLEDLQKLDYLLKKIPGKKQGHVGLFRIRNTNLTAVKQMIWPLLNEN